ncbi:MAG: VIT1/CCC1 transporter family protein [Gammaproteobacteria bacterium]|nr:VIT1/CCC1 transporter family protein [Gammaproteobacteria bacterium]MCW5583039.1 VIT1/CCC1 transporter family protein [Gammaproteobacteria bacterium]
MELYDNWWEEKRSSHLYSIMADNELNALHKKLFLDLKLAAEKQAHMWEKKIKEKQLPPPPAFSPDFRTRIVAVLVKFLGAENMHTILSAMKIRGMSVFTRYHNEHKHISVNTSSNLRAAVFGINDGLVSNMSLILGVAGANANQHFIILAGIAGLLAGACSMGAGEYISVRSQREVFEYQIAIEKQELEEYPEEEMEELSLIYQARNVPKPEADKLAKLMIDNPETGLNTLVREELGLNPEDLVSPISAMISSFFSFTIGAGIPVLPFLLGNHAWNLFASISLTGIALFMVGTILSLFTNRSPILLGLRMLTIGAIAGTITFYIGHLIGFAQ